MVAIGHDNRRRSEEVAVPGVLIQILRQPIRERDRFAAEIQDAHVYKYTHAEGVMVGACRMR